MLVKTGLFLVLALSARQFVQHTLHHATQITARIELFELTARIGCEVCVGLGRRGLLREFFESLRGVSNLF